MRRIYLDYASTTPLDQRVERAMRPLWHARFGNPSSIHAEGVAAKRALDEARTKVARALEAHPDEIVFTSGGTEANNLAILGVCRSLTPTAAVGVKLLQKHRPHIVTTTIEHTSVLEPLRQLEKEGKAEVTYVPVEPNGIVKAERIIGAIRPNTVLVSVMYANNEIGTIQPIRKIAQQIKDYRLKITEKQRRELSTFSLQLSTMKNRLPIFHVDACQAPLYLNCLVNALGVNLLTLDGHKMYGPKGVGCLYVRRETQLAPMIFGGGQERGLRSTTENVPAIVGFAEALRIAVSEREKESARVTHLCSRLYSLIRANKRIDADIVLNGSMKTGERLPNNLNISLPGVDTEFLTLQLDAKGIAASTKSSCLKDEKESYVAAALGGGTARARSTLRFTLGRNATKRDIEYCARKLEQLLAQK